MGRLVYSSDQGRMCPDCGAPADSCTCKTGRAPVGDGVVRLSRETKGRKGKAVTIVAGVPLGGSDLKNLAKRLKQLCGSGGTIRDGNIEIQGDHRDRIAGELAQHGWTIKRSGG